MTFEAGTIVLLPVPFADPTEQKLRPALVLSHRAFNELHGECIICPVTSRLGKGPFNVRLEPTEMTEGSFPVQGEIRTNRIHIIHAALVKKVLGSVSGATLAAALTAVMRAFPSNAGPPTSPRHPAP